MNNKKEYFFSIFFVLLVISFVGFTNIFATNYTTCSGGDHDTMCGGYDIPTTNWTSIRANESLNGGAKCYAIYNNMGAAMFAPTASQGEMDSMTGAATYSGQDEGTEGGSGTFTVCWNNNDMWSGQGFTSSGHCWIWDLNCDGTVEKRWTNAGDGLGGNIFCGSGYHCGGAYDCYEHWWCDGVIPDCGETEYAEAPGVPLVCCALKYTQECK